MTYFVMALAMVLGLAQCKKEQPTPQSEGVMITLNVGDNNNGSRANVNPTGTEQVTFVDGDQILVAYDGHYVGTLEKATVGSVSQFSGTINITQSDTDQPLYFYFLGNKQGTLATGATTCTVNISDQTTTAGLPVISMGKSIDAEGETVYYESGMTSFSSRLYNKCSLMKFNVTTPSTAAICLTGMNNTVNVNFGEPTEANYGFTYGMDAEDGGLIMMPGVTTENTETWAIVLPQAALEAGGENSAYTADLRYLGTRPAMEEIEMNTFLNLGLDLSVGTANPHFKDLSLLQGDLTAQDGDILSGTLANKLKISIAEGASVTLSNANINKNGTWTDGDYAGITCLGDAIIILEGTNTVKGFNSTYPGVQAGPDDGTTLTIGGSGTLNATGGSDGAAGIGSGMNASCGNITINGGTIIATGGPNGAGIGTGYTNAQGSGNISCGIITITGGTVTANGGENAAGIGTGQSRHGTQIRRNECGGVNISGGMVTATGGENGAGIGSGYGRGTRYNPISYCGDINITGGTVVATGGSNSAGIGTGNTYTFGNSNCGNITITPGVTSVTATKGTSARDSIGRGKGKGTCGTVMFGDETIYDGSLWIIAPESGSAYGGLSFSITTVTNTDDTWTLTPYVAPSAPTGAVNGLFTINAARSSEFAIRKS